MPAGSSGTLTANGLYTAPVSIGTQQTVIITATSQTASTRSGTAGITLTPPVSVSVTPANLTLTSNQTQLFTASVPNGGDNAVTWTIGPGGIGTITASGLYTAPMSIAAQQRVTITATSQADTTQSASATITLSPSQFASSGYGYQRVIMIDHTKVPNTDQVDFPFLFN